MPDKTPTKKTAKPRTGSHISAYIPIYLAVYLEEQAALNNITKTRVLIQIIGKARESDLIANKQNKNT